MAILNIYKDALDGFIDSSDSEFPDQAGSINERSRNAPRSESSSASLLEGDCLDKNVPGRSSRLTLKTEDLQVRQNVSLHLEQDMRRVRRGERTVGKIR